MSIPLSSLAEIRAGGGAPQDPSAFSDEGYPFVRAGSLTKLAAGVREEKLEKLERDTGERYGLCLFPAGTVLFAKSGMSATKGLVHSLTQPAFVVNHLAALVPRDVRDSRYIRHALQRFSPTVLIRDPAYPSIRLSDIAAFEIAAPDDPADRARIAALLDHAEALRAARRAALGHLDQLTRGIFIEMFGDVAMNSTGWPTEPLADVVQLGTIVTYGIVQAGKEVADGVPYIRTGDIVDGEIAVDRLRRTHPDIAARYNRSRLDAGDIVMSIRATVGTTALVPDLLAGANLTQGTARIAPGKRTDPTFLITYLRSDACQHWIGQQVKGATFREITLGRLRELPVPLPPIALQHAFARRIDTIERLKAAQRASLAELDTLFASLQHRAFLGDL